MQGDGVEEEAKRTKITEHHFAILRAVLLALWSAHEAKKNTDFMRHADAFPWNRGLKGTCRASFEAFGVPYSLLCGCKGRPKETPIIFWVPNNKNTSPTRRVKLNNRLVFLFFLGGVLKKDEAPIHRNQ